MLLSFGVANHLSIKKRQEISLVASSLKDASGSLFECPALPSRHVLPVAVIYGANASGKTNIVSALRTMRRLVLYSHSRGEPGGKIGRQPFRLDPSCKKDPSIFDVDYVADGIHYHYGFEVLDDSFRSEWLYAYPKNKRQVLFERNDSKIVFGRNLRGRNRVIFDLTRPNSLFISAATQNGHEELSKVSRFFQAVESDSTISIPDQIASMKLSDVLVDDRTIKFLSDIGTGVTGYRKEKIDIPDEVLEFQKKISSVLEGMTEQSDTTKFKVILQTMSLQLSHQSRDGKKIYFDLDLESAGTRRLLILLGAVFRALDEGTLLVLDELDASLHTRACEAILDLFTKKETNKKGAQLIATTHDTNLLNSASLRRDEVWFVEKDQEGSTHLYPLTDIRTRKGDNIEKGYLQGRFGAIPFSGFLRTG